MSKIEKYHYTECGLSNVYIEGLSITDDCGEECITVPNIQLLHWQIAKDIIESGNLLDGEAIRFLRSEMGLGCVQFAEKLHVAGELIEKWESDQESIAVDMDTQLRSIAADVLSEKFFNHCIYYIENQAEVKVKYEFQKLLDHFKYYAEQQAKVKVKVKAKSKFKSEIHIKRDAELNIYTAAA